MNAGDAGTITSVDTSGTTGTTTLTINPNNATYTGGAGVDKVTTTTAVPAKAISLGAGDDTSPCGQVLPLLHQLLMVVLVLTHW